MSVITLPWNTLRKYFASSNISPVGRRMLRGTLWALLGSVVLQGMGFISTLVCARTLGTAGFGELGLVRNTVSTIGVFAGIGLGLTATRYVAEFQRVDPLRAGRIMRLCLITAGVSALIMSMLFVALAPEIASRILSNPSISHSLQLGAALLLLYTYDGAQKGILAGFEAYKPIAQNNFVVGLITLPLVFVGVRFAGLNGALLAFVATALLMLVLNSRAISKQCAISGVPLKARDFWKEKGILLSFSLPSLLSSSVVTPAMWVCNAILVNQPSGYSQMGIISSTDQIRTLAMFVPSSALQCLLPILAAELNKHNGATITSKFHVINSYAAFFLTTSAVAVLLFFIGPLLLLYGKDFAAGKTAMILVLCSLPILTYKDGIARLIQAKSLMWYGFVSNSLWATCLIGSMLLFAKLGATGLALAYFIAYVVSSVVFVPIYYAKLHMQRMIKRDAILAMILSMALVPGIVSNIYTVSTVAAIGCFVVSILLIAVGGMLLARWLHE